MKVDYTGFTPLPTHVDGWGGGDSYFGELIREVKPKRIIEVGTWLGQSAFNMTKQCLDIGIKPEVICVDTWLGALEFIGNTMPQWNLSKRNGYPQVYYQFLSNVVNLGYQEYITPFPNTSLIAARYFAKNKYKADLIYIDGSHDEEDVYADVKAYLPLLNEGGVMFGDDMDAWEGVIRAVRRFSQDTGIQHTVNGRFWRLSNGTT